MECQASLAGETMDTALKEAIRRLGGLHGTGRALGIAHQAVAQWARTPALRVLEMERLSGVSRHDLRPDIYPRERGKEGPWQP